ncbi:O-antigen ligase family protein [Euzebya rosea]|uniref:O-antigen ligase family protein n=1 Tax=Euzebya rosea TaxID=2052804 RepID=UPI0013002F13|nr:O-antigen ligase family protein [Euzebya rosea]
MTGRWSTQLRLAAPALPVAVAVLAFWRASVDVFNTAKATAVVVGVLLLLIGSCLGAVATGRARLPTGRWVAAGGAVVAALSVAVLTGGDVVRQLVGAPGRHGGWVLYVACVVLAILAARPDRATRRGIVLVLVATAVPVATYALLQAVDVDPLPWTTVEGGAPVFSTFGNVDFASAWLGMVGVLAAGMALSPLRSTGIRRLGAVAAVLCVGAAVATGSLQGPVVLLAGGAVLGLRAWQPARRTGLLVTGVTSVVVVGLLLGPASGVLDGALRSVETRLPKWQAALDIVADAPLTGRGLDTYGDWFFAARAPEVAEESGLRRSVDNAHNLPLHLLTGGGIVLVLAWLVFVVALPAVGVVRRRDAVWADPEDLAVVLAWAGYLLQAMVSIDVPPLAATGFLLTGLVAGVGGLAGQREVRVVGARPVGAVGLAAVLLVVALVPVLRPWRADLVGWDAAVARAAVEIPLAEAAVTRASTIAPWDGRYHAAQGGWLTGLGLLDEALAHQQEALARSPRDLGHALNVARLLEALGRRDDAAEAYELVLEIDPHTPAVRDEVDAFHEDGPSSSSAGVASPSPPEGAGAVTGDGSSIGPPPDR